MAAYYQTTPMDPCELARAFAAARNQEDKVVAIFRAGLTAGWREMAPSQIHKIGASRGDRWVVNSVRRAMTNLTDAQVLAKVDRLRPGPHGKPEHLWRLAHQVDPV